MTIENKHLHIITWLAHLISTILYVFIVYSIYLTRFYEKLTPEIPKDYYTVFFGIIYISVLLYPTLLKYHYIYYSDEGDKIVIKTYPIGFFSSAKKTYHIPKKDFVKAEIKESFFRLRKALFIYQNLNNRSAKYPPIYINGLPKDDQKKIMMSLSRLMAWKGAVI
ncbi:MAG: hypothetical protein J7K46_02980 [Bacteroidales bacterium]|nr:hypothetical protein [Bacteroidales bacterium]